MNDFNRDSSKLIQSNPVINLIKIFNCLTAIIHIKTAFSLKPAAPKLLSEQWPSLCLWRQSSKVSQ